MYSQFIHGKLVSNRDPRYQLVARSAELTNEDNLKNMAERTHRFWGATAPDKQPRVVGIFCQGDNLVLIKAETAVDDRGNPVICEGSDFVQHRYIFIPVTSISALQGRAFKLLLWMFKQPIPLLTGFNANLEPLSIPILEEAISTETREREVEKIQQCWQNANEQKPLVLSTLAAIINGKRLLFTNEPTGIPPQNWMESILLLLPASIRPQISVAVGTLDEQQCPWATLVVKTNQHYSRSLPENMIWLNRANQTFQGQTDENTFNNSYVDYIRDHIATAPETLKQLLEQLDTIADNDITLESLADPKIIVSLIPALPEEKQHEFLPKYLSRLTIDEWEVLMPLIIKENYQQGLLFARKEIVQLIPALPEEKQHEFLPKYFSELTCGIWEALISQIINLDYQNGLLFACQQLAKNAISEPQAIPLILQAWSRLVNAKLVQLLDEIQKNLPLAEILLKEKLLLDQRRREVEDTAAIVGKLISLCKTVVTEKAKYSWIEAWQFATNLATHQLFQEGKETFSLLDTALLGEIPVPDLYKFFTLKLAVLLPDIEAEQFKQSNLHQQLTTKNLEAANLLYTLLTERNAGLAKLPLIANLIEMNNETKDNWYATFLKKWSPSPEQAKSLLAEVIKDNQKSRNNFSRDELRQTYTWFEQHQPGLKQIFDSLQQDYSWENWVNLAQAIYENENEQTKFVDTLVGNIFPVAVMQKWLPLIVDENVRRNVIDKSSAWQSLTFEGLSRLVVTSQQYVPTLTRCLRDGLRLEWIKGDLLHYLCQTWIGQKRVDVDLRDVITSPSVTNTFTTQDWLILQRLSWEPDIQMELPLGVKTALTSEQKKSLQMDAKTIVVRYTRPEQTRRLLNDCAAWGLSLTEQKEILKDVQPSACNVDLIIPYLYREGKAINPAEEQQLIGLLLQQQLNQGERADVEKFSVEVFTQYILPNRNLTLLKWWRDKAVEKQLYKQAFYSAAQQYVRDISITGFCNYIKDLKTASLVEESGWMFKAMFSCMPIPIPDLLIQPIIDLIQKSTF
jgi:hypothetical protein